jgi:hypothetical protein
MKLLSFNEYINEQNRNYYLSICEGGSYGHMSHPYDDTSLTFAQIRDIIDQALQGQLNKEIESTEKLDGQAIAISWKDDHLIAARNKGDRKGGGAAAMNVQGVIDKFQGRGDLSDGFSFAIQDLDSAISKIPAKDRESIFKNGYAFMHLEVIYPPSSNVINYDAPHLIFHSATTYDEEGIPVSSDKSAATTLQKLIKSVNSDIQKHYTIRPPAVIDMPKVIDFEKNQKRFMNIIDKLQKKWGGSSNDTIGDYMYAEWQQYLINKSKSFNEDISGPTMGKLIDRWSFFNNNYTVRDMKKELPPKFQKWAIDFSKKEFKQVGKDILAPFEELFLSLGVEVLKNATGYLAANPDKVVQDIKKQLEDLQKQIEKSGDLDLMHKMKIQLARLQSIGGFDAILPTEGIVFQYNGKTYKLTGAFASVNNILGTLKYSR